MPNDIYDDLSITNKEFTILILLYRYYAANRSIGIYSIQMLIDLLRVNIKNNTKIVGEIKDTIISLIEKKYIIDICNLDGEKNIDNKNSFFYLELIPPAKEFYFMIKDDNIDEILKYCQTRNLSKYDLIRYFVACRRMSNNEAHFGYLTQLKLKQLINDSRTIQRYNKILQDDLHLIRYDNNYLTPEKHYCRTFIGEYDDKFFDKKVKDMASSEGLVFTDKNKSNKKRSIKQKINNTDVDDKTKIKQLEKQLQKIQYKEHSSDDEEIIDLLKELDKDSIPESLKLTEKLINNKDDSYENDHYDDWDDDDEDKQEMDLPESIKWLNNYDDYNIETLKLFLDSFLIIDNDHYLDCFDDISNHHMTIKEFFDDVYEYADYDEYLEFKAKKEGKTQLTDIDISTIGVEDDWGESEPIHKKCICCGENFPDTSNDTWCPECRRVTKRHSQKAQEQQYEYDEADW